MSRETTGRIRVLMLPHNVSSDMDFRVEALRKYQDLEIRAYTTHVNKMLPSKYCMYLPSGLVSMNPFKRIWAYILYYFLIRREFKWADVVHWYWDFNYIPILKFPLEYHLLKQWKKKGLILWCGSEIRNPDIDKSVNPYYKREKETGQYEYTFESAKRSSRTQILFNKLGFVPLEFIGIGHYIDKRLFPKTHRVYQLIGLKDYQPVYPSPNQAKPLIVHSASKTGGKGTKYVLQALDNLKAKFDFEFVLINNMSKEEALSWVRKCDLFIDQLITGSHGTAAVEAMAMGKPVLCYINPVVGQNYSEDLPILNANPDTIQDVLQDLLDHPVKRNEIGRKSRLYVEKYHDDEKNAANLYALYMGIMDAEKI
ncbi:MAG: glycosyltransferase [Saprospiraceae bacterium]|nr:glycosyltransferase [Saprospiraceae bacterium]